MNQSEISYCIWCTRNKEFLPCVKCNYKCCYDCITNNLGTLYIDSVNEKNWLCFVCDCDPIENLQKEYYKFSKLLRNEIEPLAPEGAASSIDITSPYILVDESEDSYKKFSRKTAIGSQDLDSILNMYEKQIKASLELDDANIPSILSEINSIKTEHLSTAIHSIKKCLSAFASDLTNLESRVSQAVTTNNQLTLNKLTSLLRILIQHHIFNRLSHPKARIQDDLKASSNDKSSSNNAIVIPPINNNNNNNQKMVFIVDPKYLKNTKRKLPVEKLAVDLNNGKSKDFTISDLSRIINTLASNGGNKRSMSVDGNSSQGFVAKRARFYEEESRESVELKAERQRRSLITPSWLSDFKVEKENDNIPLEEKDSVAGDDDDDDEWTDYRFKDDLAPRKRGRPPKFPKSSPPEMNNDLMSDLPKRARGRPKKNLNLNDKQPRFYIPKLNGDALLTIDNNDI